MTNSKVNKLGKKSALRQLSPSYKLVDEEGNRRIPRNKEVLKQYLNMLNPMKSRSHWLHLHLEFSFYFSLGMTILFLTKYLSIKNILKLTIIFYVLANLINTIWYHRYCTHASFKFSSDWVPKFVLWLNPVTYREEVYVYNHLLHHKDSDNEEDPYGPHLGWLGNFLASPFYKVDKDMNERDFLIIKRMIDHTGIVFSSYESFRKWGSVESIPHFLARSTFSNLLWSRLMWRLGGIELLSVWYTAIFAYHAVARDFNYRGHDRKLDSLDDSANETKSITKALNQVFYGYSAGEWHNNHHNFSSSANTGFLSSQLDLPFQFIRLLKKVKVVSSYKDSKSAFLRKNK